MGFEIGAYTVIDVETTGLYPQYGHRICEIGALRVENGEEAARFEQLVDPRRPVSRGAFEVNRITPDMLEGQPLIEEVMPRFLEFIKGSVLVGYNTGFDLAFIESEVCPEREYLNGYRVIDALVLARRLFPGFSRYKLTAVADELGIRENAAHRAMADVLMTWHVFQKEMDLLEERGVETLEDISWICRTEPFRRMPPGSPKVSILQKAIEENRMVKIKYRSRWDDKTTERTVTPISMPQGFDSPYLVAYCHLRQAQRNFRLDCIIDAEL